MRISTLIIVAFVAVPPDVSRRLHVTPVPLQPAMTQSVIVGRSVCGGSTWLLTRSADLIRLGRESRTPTVRRVSQRLSRVGPSGDERQSVALAPAVRLIVWADASGCVLLTVNGSLLRVSESGGSK